MTDPVWREHVMHYVRAEALPVEKFGHQPRLYALTQAVGAGLDYDDDVLFAAAWLHDLGVFAGHRPSDPDALARWNHVPYTVEKTRQLLMVWGFPAAKLAHVEEAIRTHQPGDTPTTIEGVILRDADILEQLGAVGVMRAVCKVGRDTRYPTFSSVVAVLQRALEDLPAKLRLEASRSLAVPRVTALAAFLAAAASEAGELLF